MNLRRLFRIKTCFIARREMICIRSQHFSLNKILFLVIGLWPYQQSRLTRLQTVLFLSILTSFNVFQVC